ncbi:MAG: Bug family tripartite tricarboxylate transporter substrate binding protein [Xanthobacteraceae bacterium]
MSAFCCRSTRFLTKLKATLHIPATLSLPRAAWAFAPLAICLAGGSIAGIGQALAQDYPSRPVRWTIGFPAGGSTDTLVRIMAEWLQMRLGQTVLVENKSGAGSNIATEAVINAPPDGYTLAAVTSANAINATISKRAPTFDFLKDLAPVAGLAQGPSVMVVHPSVPANSVAEFIAYARANPGKINMGTPGVGTTGHMAGELFKAMAGVDLVHVPYRGSAPAITDLIGGQVQVMFDAMISTLPQIQSGKIRALAVTAATRSAMLPNVPTIAETVPGYEAIIWYGVGVPRGTPTDVVAKLNREINAGLTSTKMRSQLSELGSTPIIATPDEFWAFARSETEKWEKVIRQSGAKID